MNESLLPRVSSRKILCLALAACTAIGALAADPEPRNDNRAFHGVQTSDRVIAGTIRLPGVELDFDFTVADGTLVTAENDAGNMYAFSPAIFDDASLETRVAWLPLRVLDAHPGHALDQVRGFSPVALGLAEQCNVSTQDGTFRIEALAIAADDRELELTRSPGMLGRSGSGRCCVTCEAWSVCATRSVSSPCGTCRTTEIGLLQSEVLPVRTVSP